MTLFRVDSGSGFGAFIVASTLLACVVSIGPVAAQDCQMQEIIKNKEDLDDRYIANINCARKELETAKQQLKDHDTNLADLASARHNLEKLIEEQGARLSSLDEAIRHSQEQFKEFEKNLSAFTNVNGLVAAFDRGQSAPCPQGWRLFGLAGGRFIVGAGDNQNQDMHGNPLTDRAVEQIGGEETHVLDVHEDSDHFHNVFMREIQTNATDGDGKWLASVEPANKSKSVQSNDTEHSGQSQPHNTMPPFVALYYCIKE